MKNDEKGINSTKKRAISFLRIKSSKRIFDSAKNGKKSLQLILIMNGKKG